ncbi:accessory Sec system protein translocase subunit SecY2 [Streptococcus loxodontisalivarius]|uniref:Accessory Sec system protein translocase subunit SecY2 n=1 Tax=Streptococcus loxodontisalivarius TaxID=1349415 RepID=A0ABS2PTV2_9STRE|nr:accessory Sec system protein translocase subunit SecY2 [Streptococcus loxodontisalivarius]MBM7643486.1 preprotein translocase subunit SecY [Streptococcus loxodontisalivarius]
MFTKLKSSKLVQRILWTLLIMFIYMLGRSIPVTTVAMDTGVLAVMKTQTLLNNMAVVTGGQLSEITLFSLGIGPWMTGMIIWRFFTVFGMFKNLTTSQLNRNRMILTFLIALIQAFGLTAGATFTAVDIFGMTSPVLARILTMIFMITGSYVLVWLGNMNSVKGLGGMMIIIIVNMILSFFNNLGQYFSDNSFTGVELLVQIAIFATCLILLMMVTVVTYRAEYRIPVRRLGVSNHLTKDTYLPIRVMPAGGMPFMYGMTLMMLPPIIFSSLLSFFPENQILTYLSLNTGLSTLPGVLIYAVILYFLAIGFAYYNYDSYDIAKNMRNTGDYIEHVKPGKPTQKFIQAKINIFAQIGAVFVILMGAGPLFFIVGQSGKTSIALLISNVFIVISLMLTIIEQVNTLLNWRRYKNLL